MKSPHVTKWSDIKLNNKRRSGNVVELVDGGLYMTTMTKSSARLVEPVSLSVSHELTFKRCMTDKPMQTMWLDDDRISMGHAQTTTTTSSTDWLPTTEERG